MKNLVIFVRGLHFKTRENNIREFFKDQEIEKVFVVKDNNGKPKGLAFIEFKNFSDL